MIENITGNEKAVIFGLAGTILTDEERVFFTQHNPLGFILFARNCESPDQVRALTRDLRQLAGRSRLLILIDQEGGRVARLKPPHWRKAPPAAIFASLFAHSPEQARQATYLNARLIAQELFSLGITVNCAPMADIPVPGSHDIVGDRAFGTSPEQVVSLAREMARGLMDGGVLPVLKHIPGHGRAKVDSHESLPMVDASLSELRRTDFIPFRELKDIPLGMTAHILYTAIDEKAVATLSPVAIRLIREELGYEGLLMSDDLSMKALAGSFAELTQKTLSAGCDIILHCNGKMQEMQEIAEACPLLDEHGRLRAARALSCLQDPLSFEVAASQQALDALLAPVA